MTALTAVLSYAVFAATLVGTGLVLKLLRRGAILDRPNPRSSHRTPTPRGGGLAVVPLVVASWLGLGAALAVPLGPLLTVAAGALALALVSWLDDLKGLPVAARLAAHVLAVTGVLAFAPPGALYFAGWLPPAADHLAAGALWVWFINLYNFMDGIDGITGGETAAIGIGAALVALVHQHDPQLVSFGLTLAAAALGFLAWNWQPAKVFLGDVGSVPFGFLAGWLLLQLSAAGQPIAALILPLYYLADATFTLARRIVRGERPWQAHRQHFYQRAVRRGVSHAAVAGGVLVADVALVVLAAIAAVGQARLAIVGACVVVTALLIFLAGRWPNRPPGTDRQ